MLNIIKFPNPILREKVENFDFENCILDPFKLEQELIETMLANDGIGLAAVQVGLAVRVFVMGHKANPELSHIWTHDVFGEWEGKSYYLWKDFKDKQPKLDQAVLRKVGFGISPQHKGWKLKSGL